jgi:hypothetical protein
MEPECWPRQALARLNLLQIANALARIGAASGPKGVGGPVQD